jgi:hypothetical protein
MRTMAVLDRPPFNHLDGLQIRGSIEKIIEFGDPCARKQVPRARGADVGNF